VPLAELALECGARRGVVPAPVAAAVLAAAWWLIPAGERTGRGERRFEVPGAVTITAAMLLLVYTVVSAQQAGWGSARTIGSFVMVGVLLGVFAVIERRSRDPLVPFAIFSRPALRRANIGAVTLFGTYISFQFLVTQYLQTFSGWSAMSTALAFLPAGVAGAGSGGRSRTGYPSKTNSTGRASGGAVGYPPVGLGRRDSCRTHGR
jgi:hypothetical protein